MVKILILYKHFFANVLHQDYQKLFQQYPSYLLFLI
nr:MAG TPA: hypothetical protein [Bacteriophage sp.]